MTDDTAGASQGKSGGSGGLEFLPVVITTILKSLWSTINGINDPQTKKSEKFWDMVSDDFDKQARAEEKNGEHTHLKTVNKTKKYLRESDVVLDFGCATGTVALEIVNNVKAVYGIDISSKMIEAAQRKAAECNTGKCNTGKLFFFQSTLSDERLKKESYDVILVLNILHFMEDIPKTMQRIHELLKPGGLFISATPCMGEKTSVLRFLLSLVTKIGIIPPMNFYKISDLEGSVTKGNFHIIETECLNPTEYFMVAKKI